MHEASLYPENCFITLTYDDEHMPENRSVNGQVWKDFRRRLTRYIEKTYAKKIRYFACAEYGSLPMGDIPENLGRPHYHAIIFNHSFMPNKSRPQPGQECLEKSADGGIWTSPELSRIWPYGHVSVGPVTQQTAAYVARYSLKKINGDMAEDHYRITHEETGEQWQVEPEFMRSSQRPGIGIPWLMKYEKDCEKGYITHKGIHQLLPDAYDKWLDDSDNLIYAKNKEKAFQKLDELDPERAMDRLRIKEKVAQIRMNRSKKRKI